MSGSSQKKYRKALCDLFGGYAAGENDTTLCEPAMTWFKTFRNVFDPHDR